VSFNSSSGGGSALVIAEVTGTNRRTAVLVGAGLPFQGAGWKTGNRVPTDWYPGNGVEATQQVLGPKELPSTWEGVWRRNMLLRSPCFITSPGGQQIKTATPSILKDFLDSLFWNGARLRVSWLQTKIEVTNPLFISQIATFGVQSLGTTIKAKIVREGRAKEWEFNPERSDDIKWTVSWEWVSRGQAQLQKAVSTRDDDPSALAAQVTGGVNDVVNLINTPSTLSLGQLEAFAKLPLTIANNFSRQILALQSRFQQIVGIGLTLAETPAQLANETLNLATNTVAIVNQTRQQFGEVPAELNAQGGRFVDVMRATNFQGQVYEAARTLGRTAQASATKSRIVASTNPGGGVKGSQQTAATTAAQILAVYRAKDTDTPQTVAAKFYGNADQALAILQANHLPYGLTAFVGNPVLIIPRLGAGATRQ
jgi:hypothetical protein